MSAKNCTPNDRRPCISHVCLYVCAYKIASVYINHVINWCNNSLVLLSVVSLFQHTQHWSTLADVILLTPRQDSRAHQNRSYLCTWFLTFPPMATEKVWGQVKSVSEAVGRSKDPPRTTTVMRTKEWQCTDRIRMMKACWGNTDRQTDKETWIVEGERCAYEFASWSRCLRIVKEIILGRAEVFHL
jgi:hypothetical protein